MQNILIYGGIGINVLGALLIMFCGVQYYINYRQIKNMPMRVDDLKARWGNQRRWGFGLMIGGLIIAMIGCFI